MDKKKIECGKKKDHSGRIPGARYQNFQGSDLIIISIKGVFTLDDKLDWHTYD